MRLNPAVEHAPANPFLRLAETRRRALARGIELVDLSMGQPTDPAPARVRDALAEAALSIPLCEYPATGGLPELREAIAAWIARRFGVTLDPERELLPTLGAKEPIALLARLFARSGDALAVGTPGYPDPRAQRARGRAPRDPSRTVGELGLAARPGCDRVGEGGDRVGRNPPQPERGDRPAGAAGGAGRALPPQRRDPRRR